MSRLLRRWRHTALACFLGSLAAATAHAADAPVPVESFFKLQAVSEVVMSPSGQHLALVISGPDQITALAIADIATPSQFKGIAKLDSGSIYNVQWVNDQRLVFSTIDFQLAMEDQRGGTGLLAVNRDGSNFRRLITSRGITESGAMAREPLAANHSLFSVLRDGTSDVIVQRYNFEETRTMDVESGGRVETDLLRMNTENNGARPLLKDRPDNAAEWLVDGQGKPRVVVTYTKGRSQVQWREGETEKWRQLLDQDAVIPEPGSFDPLSIGLDGQLYVVAVGSNAAGTSVLKRFDMATGKPAAEALVALDGYDFSGSLVWDLDQKKLVGVRYLTDAEGTSWLEPSLRELQAQVDKLLPNTNNTISCGGRCLSLRRVLVWAGSDLQPPIAFVFDRDSGKLELVAATRPWIDPRRMAQRDLVRITARDGLSLPVQITKPKGKGPFPAVVLVHGGPYVPAAAWRWSPDSQFLASRGYLVVEPDFRGTQRYGYKHESAGWKQWGLKMQDDVTDATEWAVQQGLADPRRLVIAGASYGGYATMMGLVKEPELYRAGINWVGVTDIALLYTISWSDGGEDTSRYYLPRKVADRDKDAAQIVATSPLKQAARIKRPVLMAYGEEDLRVPLPHGTQMRDALRRAGVPVEWVSYAGEGHGFLKLENKVDFWTRVERFLEANTR
jgi:dipeptidyl aminopeptidase/acylaminoacyl peptidase